MEIIYVIIVNFWQLMDKLNDKVGDDIVLDFFNDLGAIRRKICDNINRLIDKITSIRVIYIIMVYFYELVDILKRQLFYNLNLILILYNFCVKIL